VGLDPWAASRRAEILCHALCRRQIFCGSAKFQLKMEVLLASQIFFGAYRNRINYFISNMQ